MRLLFLTAMILCITFSASAECINIEFAELNSMTIKELRQKEKEYKGEWLRYMNGNPNEMHNVDQCYNEMMRVSRVLDKKDSKKTTRKKSQ